MKTYKPFINGEYQCESTTIMDDLNPSDGSVFAKVHMANKQDIENAISAAHKAQKSWAKVAPRDKEAILLKVADIFQRKADEIKEILMKESGSVFSKCMFEIGLVSDLFKVAAGEARRVKGETFVSNDDGVFSYAIRRPLGVIAGISPFNVPLVLSARKFAFAIAAGNAFVLKPSSHTPVCGLLFGEIFKEAGLPDGVFNVIPCNSKDLGETFQNDKRISMITFTGSTEVGKKIAKSAAENMKKCTFELGGKSPVLILEDADVDFAVDSSIFGIFMHQGQICMAGTKIIVHESIHDEFCQKFVKKAQSLKVGDPQDPTTVIGPLIEAKQCDFIDGLIDDAVKKGANLLTGRQSQKSFYQPTVLSNVNDKMDIFHTEAFGPAVVIIKAKTLNEFISIANNTDYGLSASVITNDIQNYLTLAEEIETGMLHINGPTIQDEAHIPFGGVKLSGLGREGGHYSIEEMTELKWITVEGIGNHKFPF